ncbi:RBX2 [Lepeophtheirus salmonis]|uniref:RING-box protein 2 n=1 Tax=Lepeophtheirus salmonis TaxID=72036 RepID=A0A7R8CHP0_LEPSM|nr:RBX2 [Lepeophtheirus salmonis]CAF2825243.1 RBX2 [Lepeophtheirus salmonis]
MDSGLVNGEETSSNSSPSQKLFSLKRWNAVAMWSWDVECDTCAICRVQVMDACLRCQSENNSSSSTASAAAAATNGGTGSKDCVVVWGECNHSFHQCCMSLWIKQNNRCPLCQQEWTVQKLGK